MQRVTYIVHVMSQPKVFIFWMGSDALWHRNRMLLIQVLLCSLISSVFGLVQMTYSFLPWITRNSSSPVSHCVWAHWKIMTSACDMTHTLWSSLWTNCCLQDICSGSSHCLGHQGWCPSCGVSWELCCVIPHWAHDVYGPLTNLRT